MDKFKQTIKKRIVWSAIAGAVFFMLLVFFAVTANMGSHAESFSDGFQTGVFTGGLILVLLRIVRYVKALRDPEKLKKLYVAETDERTKFVAEKANAATLTVVVIALYIATTIASAYNMIVFSTLLAVLCFIVFVLFCFKMYYRSKY